MSPFGPACDWCVCMPSKKEQVMEKTRRATIPDLPCYVSSSHWGAIFILAVPCSMRDLSSPTRDRTRAPSNGSAESSPLDRQGSPGVLSFWWSLLASRGDSWVKLLYLTFLLMLRKNKTKANPTTHTLLLTPGYSFLFLQMLKVQIQPPKLHWGLGGGGTLTSVCFFPTI